MKDAEVIIIGAGIAGLSAAWELTRAGRAVRVLEASGQAGGVISSQAHAGFVAEEGADSFLTSKTAMTTLCEELGIAGEIVAALPHAGGARVLHQGKLQTLPAGWRMLTPARLEPVLESPLFSPEVKQALAAHWTADTDADAAPHDDESIAAYLRRRFGALAGQAIADTVAGPMAAGVYGGDAETLAVPPPSPPPPPGITVMFASLRTGMGSLPTTLQRALPAGTVRSNCPVQAVRPEAGGWQVVMAGGAFQAPALIVATPAWAAAAVFAAGEPAVAEPLAAITYSSSLNINLAYTPAPPLPPGYGFLVPHAEGYRLLACTFAHQKFPHRAPAGAALLRLFYPGDALQLSDAAAVELGRREIAAILGVHDRPLWTAVRRAPRSLPLYTVEHRQRLQALQAALARHPRLALAGSAYAGVGVPDCIASGRAAAQRVLTALR